MVRILISLVVVALVWPVVSQAAPVTTDVTNYIYPLSTWDITTHQGEAIGGGLYHMGVDVGGHLPAGTPVYAVADGVVKEAQVRTQFGLVVLIEHRPVGEDPNVSLYGHLDPDQVLVTPGQVVKVGDVIGVLGNETNNGGWPVHLHFGIYKAAYTGEWVYYGHVYDQADVRYWDDPETYIPAHLVRDYWKPSVSWDLAEGNIIGDHTPIVTTSTDIGSGMKSLLYKVNGYSIAYSSTLDLSSYPDGPIAVKLIARDQFNNKTTLRANVIKDNYRYTTPAFITMRRQATTAIISTWSYAGHDLAHFQTTANSFATNNQFIVVGKGTAHLSSKVKVFSTTGTVQKKFKAFPNGHPHLALSTDNKIIVGSGAPYVSTVRAYSTAGVLLWEMQPFGTTATTGVQVATIDTTGDGSNEVIASAAGQAVLIAADGSTVLAQFPLAKGPITTGDVTGDGIPEIIVGTQFYTLTGELLSLTITPFAGNKTGKYSMTTLQWDTAEDEIAEQELLVSHINHHSAQFEIYRMSSTPELVTSFSSAF